MSKQKLFISHTTKESPIAQLLKKRTQKAFLGRLSVFVSSDAESIQAGSKWLDVLSEALQGAKFMIVLCSKGSVERPWVNFEAGAGWILDIPIIPVCHSGLDPEDVPMPLKILQAVEASKPEGLKKLYAALAKGLRCDIPEIDFDFLAKEIKELEAQQEDVQRIEHPRLLCAASEQFSSFNFDSDVKALEDAFPGRVTVERKLTSKRLRDLLTSKPSFDLLHLVLAVDPASGDLIFSLTGAKHRPTTTRVDRMSPEGFATLLLKSQTSLVVLATCYALFLALEVSRVTNMVATQIEITGEETADWGNCFYDLLAKGHPLFDAAEITRSNCSVPLRLIPHKNVAFASEARKARARRRRGELSSTPPRS